jgi:hypothetical protein
VPRAKEEPSREEPSEDQVDWLHRRFYGEVERLWAKHHKTFPGYEQVELRVVWD